MKFINSLINMSFRLKKIPEGEQSKRLKEFLQKINGSLKNNRFYKNDEIKQKNNYQALNFFEGILFPFSINENLNSESNLIVGINEDHFLCFNTRKRVPYMIVIETIE
jgi:phosphatidylinositol 4-kinase B